MTGNLSLSVTTIENFRYITSIEDDEDRDQKLDEFVLGLSMKIPPTRKMEVGTAFGEIIRKPAMHFNSDAGVYQANGYEFSAATINAATSVIDYRGLFEVPVFASDHGVELKGRLDYWAGNEIIDFKTKLVKGECLSAYESNKLLERYQDSVQWRLYCEMVSCKRFRYVVFILNEDTLELVDILEIPFYYSPMDVSRSETAIRSLVQFIEFRGLTDHYTKVEAEGVPA